MFENKVLTHNGKVFDSKVNSLTFQVSGDRFPIGTSAPTYPNQYFRISSTVNQKVLINWGDGNIIPYDINPHLYFTFDYNYLPALSQYVQPPYEYTDGNDGLRSISFEFENIKAIEIISFKYIELHGTFPDEIKYVERLRELTLDNPLNLDGFPLSSYHNLNLESLNISRVSPNLLPQIPDFFFDTDVSELILNETFDLSDIISSNFFKINQLKESLKVLILNYNNVSNVPEEIAELINLEHLGLRENPIISFPSEISSLVNLRVLELGENKTNFINTSWGDLTGLAQLESLSIRTRNLDVHNLQVDWIGLKSLKNINTFYDLIFTDSRFNIFINSLYTLCTNEANITEDATAFGGEYPHRFRDISWGDASLAFTGTKQAPQGYVQGSSNGTPANEGEKVYVMQNQYGHVIDHA